MNRKASAERGFTLLEVIVALAITGFVLGGLFTLLGSSKQLSLRSVDSLRETADLRATVNFALLENEFNEVEPVLQDERFDIRPGDLLEDPIRKTAGTTEALQSFEIFDTRRNQTINGTRWVRLLLPR
ncbi:MAG: type II secretion system protein [Gammaproteobacteria bacterium]|nr:prepilin-type N-terminal cleavage/methylation domain-containing protein [Gammaproteobacteria bacterium]MXX06998.1 type II secretion system protein [Gammaproteobacteria bacterium]MXZ32282.1 type II secretion system protein [Gammaproteobacteria bacterium]MYE29562.1 type II secretion system protein [Gammaproteobacteria bacterium]MYE99257.1 type II secretion system protein [Gammaproteobacteria bacterium]